MAELAAVPVLLAPVLGAGFGAVDCWAVPLGGELCGEAPACARDLPPNVASNATDKTFQRRRFTVFPLKYLPGISVLSFCCHENGSPPQREEGQEVVGGSVSVPVNHPLPPPYQGGESPGAFSCRVVSRRIMKSSLKA